MKDGLRTVAPHVTDTRDVADWLTSLNWDDPASAASRTRDFLSGLREVAEKDGDSRSAALYHAVLDWLDRRQDRGHTEASLAAVGMLCGFYEHVQRPLRGMAAISDEALLRFASAGAEMTPHLSRLLRYIQTKARYRAEDIDRVLGAQPRLLEEMEGAPVDPLWMREPAGGSARFAAGPAAGVVVTCYNLGQYLFEALDSLARQTLPEFEVIIVNDGSTCRFTKGYLHYLEERGYRVLHQANTGLAEARNNGIRALSSRFLCCFDADDILHPEWLERASGLLASSPEAGYVSCHYATFDTDHSVYRYDHPRYPEMLVENQTVGVSVFRRECWERSGGYCRDFQGMEDWDFWLSVLDLGFRGERIPETLFYYRTRIASMYALTRETERYMANLTLLMARHRVSFEAYWPEVVELRARRLMELLNLRGAETKSRQEERMRHLLITEMWEKERGSLQRQAEASERRSSEAVARAGQLVERLQSETQAQLKETQEQLRSVHTSLAGIEARLARPGAAVRFVRNAFLLLASNSLGGAKWKNLGLAIALLRKREARAIWTEQFDANWYCRTHTDVARSGISPALHYLMHGHAEGRAPSAVFDSVFYLQRHPDVRTAGLNPLLHYALFGAQERRTTAPPSAGVNAAANRIRYFRSQRTSTAGASTAKPLVTVVIPCFNYGEHLAEAVHSVLAQTLSNVEAIIVEGGSTDGVTPGIVRRLEESGLPRTRFLYRPEPHLTGDNRNFGIEEARTKYVCCLDADDTLKPHYLEVAAFLAETHGYDLVYPSAQAFGGGDFVWRLHDADAHTITDHNQVSTVAMFRRHAWEEVNGYRDFGRKTEYVAEDWEFWVRLLRAGYRARCIPQPLQMYRIHTAGIWHGERSSVEYQRKKIVEANAQVLAAPPVLKPLTPAPNAWGTLLQPPASTGAILLALPFVLAGGAEKLFEMIIRSETAQGRKVVVITTLVLADTIKDVADHFHTLTPYFYALPGLLRDDMAIWDGFVSYLIDQYSVDLILISGCDYMYHALPHLTQAFPNLGVVDQLFNQEVHFPTNRHYARYIDVTMVPSPAFATRMIEEFGEDPERTAVIPHGVDIPVLPDPDDRADVRRRSGLPAEWADCFLAGFFGRMSPEKAPVDFVEIARRLKSEPKMRFVMTGEGPELQRVREAIRRYGLEDRVFAPGFVADPRELMSAVDAIVVPSILDGMPLVVLESQALGKVVVASAVGSIPVMIEDGKTGYLCRPGDISGFAAKLRELAANPSLGTVGLAGRDAVAAHHSSDAMLRRYDEAFHKARASKRTFEAL